MTVAGKSLLAESALLLATELLLSNSICRRIKIVATIACTILDVVPCDNKSSRFDRKIVVTIACTVLDVV